MKLTRLHWLASCPTYEADPAYLTPIFVQHRLIGVSTSIPLTHGMITQLIYLTPLARFAEISQLTPLPNNPITAIACFTYQTNTPFLHCSMNPSCAILKWITSIAWLTFQTNTPFTHSPMCLSRAIHKLPKLGKPPQIARSACITHLQLTRVTRLRFLQT